MSDGELKKEPTGSEKLKAEIEAMQSAQAKPEVSTPEVPSAQSTPEKAPQPTAEINPAPALAGQAESQPQAPTDKKAGKPETDIKEWAKRKGIKDEESALRSLRELERELTRSRQQAKVEPTVPQGTPQWQPTPQYAPPPVYQPAPQYPPPFVDRQRILEQEAANYGMQPDDFEKVLKVASDISAIQMRRLKAEQESEMSEIRRENRRNSEMRELMQDPLFSNEEVQFEMHAILKENPKALDLEPTPLINAFNEAQRRLARRYLEKGRSAEAEVAKPFPSKPPTEGTRGSSPSFEQNSETELLKTFQKGSAEEMKKVLTSIGARPTL